MGTHLKKGSVPIVFATLCLFAIILLLAISFIVYYQFSVSVMDIKSEMFYTVQNSIIAYDREQLSYNNYQIDEKKLVDYIEDILARNYVKENSSIKSIRVVELKPYTQMDMVYAHTNSKYTSPVICVKLAVEYLPTISLNGGNSINISLHEDVKITLLEYGG